VITEGDETVLVGGKPVARVGDDHKCGKKRHVGGPVVPPAGATVIIGGQPVARVGDEAVCRPGNDTIKEGEPTVLIGSGGPTAAMSARGREVLASYEQKLTSKLQITSRDLAAGRMSKELSAKDMQSWLTGLMMDMPVGDTPLGQALASSLGLSGDDLNLSPKELLSRRGKEFGERTKEWVEEFKGDHPGLFWSAAVLAALGASALTYSQGTDVLKKVGVKPKYKQAFFDKALEVDAALEFGEEFSDPRLEFGSKQKIGDNLTLWQRGSVQGEDVSHLDLVKYSLGADYSVPLADADDKLKLGLSYSHDGLKQTDQVGGYLRGRGDGYSYGLDALVDPGSGDYKVSGYAGRKLGESGHVEGFVQQQSVGGVSQTSAGVMLRFSF